MSRAAPSPRPDPSTTAPAARRRTGALAFPRAGLGLALAAALASAALIWLSLLPTRAMTLDVGNFGSGDRGYLDGVYNREADSRDPAARTWRWASGDAVLSLPTGQSGAAIFSAELYAAPQPEGRPLDFALRAGDQTLAFAVSDAERTYRVLIPAAAAEAGVVRLRLASPTVTPPGDDRSLAVALDKLGLSPVGRFGMPALPLLGLQLVTVGALALLAAANRARGRAIAGAALAGALLLAALNLGARSWSVLAAWPLAAVVGALAAISLLAERLLPRGAGAEARFARHLWLIFLGGLALRLAGVHAPAFAFNDLDVQALLFGRVVAGQIYLFENAHEFGGGMTFYPSGPYVLALPLLLLRPALPFALHTGAALFDALGVALVALIARELGLGRRAALIAAALMAALPIQLTALWWGFFTNIGGQTLVLLMLWLLLRQARRPTRWSAALLFVGLSLVLVAHVGVLILTGMAGALTLALAWLPQRPTPQAWRGLLLAGLGALAVFILTYLSFVVAPMLSATTGVLAGQEALSPERLADGRAYILRILPVALWRGVGMLPFLLLLPGLPLIWARARHPLGRAVALAWAATPLVFVIIEYIYLVQVRYIYFLAPLCCLASGEVLGRLWARRAGRPVVIVSIALVAWLGVALWYSGAVYGLKMSLVPLTH